MDGHYNHMPAHGTFYQHDQSAMPNGNFEPMLHRIQTMSSDTLNQYSDDGETGNTTPTSTGAPKAKRRTSHGPDHIKHRRTRSGCYTCRQRRVKCDESHPTCERCRKGKRDCVYPDPNSNKPSSRDSSSKNKSFLADSGSNSSGEDDFPEHDKLPMIPDEEGLDMDDMAEPTSAISTRTFDSEVSGHDSMSPSNKEKSPSSHTEPASRLPRRPQVLQRVGSRPQPKSATAAAARFAALPKDVRFYIRYHRDQISHHHYSIKYDSGDFLKTTFLEIALGYEPLLHAVCAFASYFHQLSLPNGRIQTFLHYYDKSVRMLRQSLLKNSRHSIATLLTILQLASFEECLGDWVNLLGHQKAAYEILVQLFTPQTVMQSETHRKIITWYIRFDIISGLMSGNETTLGREWHAAVTDFYERQAKSKPNDLPAAFEQGFAKSRLLATDISLVFGKKAKGLLSDEEFIMALGDLKQQQEKMSEYLDTAFADRRKYITEFPNAPKNRENDLTEELEPDLLLGGEMWTWNFLLIDFWGLSMMFKGQLTQIDKSVNAMEVVQMAFKIGKMFEALQYASTTPNAVVLGAQPSVGIAATAMPKDHKHVMWCRRKYAQIESAGYIYPAILRKRMSDAWNADVTSWWLPEGEHPPCPPLIRAIREFLEYRATMPHDQMTEEVRDMKAFFNAMSIEDPDAREAKSTGTVNSDDFIDLGAFGNGTDGGMSFDSSPDMSWYDMNWQEMQSTDSLSQYSPLHQQLNQE